MPISKSQAGGLLLVTLFSSSVARAKTLTVGPSGDFAKPCQAFAAASDGDRIEIDSAGPFVGDVCAVARNGLTIVGTGTARAKIDAGGKNALGKAIWVVQGDDTTIENIEFTGATVPDKNGAGIRQEGKNLTVRGCSFHDNEDGILAGDSPSSVITIESSEFDHNGAGDGYSHNLYINHVARLTFRYNYSHRAVVGHLLKTRAAENYILYNRLSGESDGTESYEIDVPNGGKTYVIGNVIEQGSGTQNPTMLSFLAEGANASNPSHSLFVVNNSFVNHLGRGPFVSIGSAATAEPVLRNNIFLGVGEVPAQASASNAHNYAGTTSCFVNATTLDLALLPNTACVDAGVDPGSDGSFSLLPTEQYVHPSSHAPRASIGPLDIGAYEYSPEGGAPGANEGGRAATGGGTGGGAPPASSGGAGGGPFGGGRGGAAAFGGANSGGTSPASSGGAPPQSSGGASTNSGGTAGGRSSGGMSSASAGDESGCGCRVHGRSGPSSVFSLLLALGFARLRRLRAPRRSKPWAR